MFVLRQTTFVFNRATARPHAPRPQNRKIVLFDLAFHAKWEGRLLDAAGATVGSGDGDVTAADIEQDCFSATGVLDVALVVRGAADGGAHDTALAKLFAAHAAPLLRAKLATFVAELRAKWE
jgi:hypothetical protein